MVDVGFMIPIKTEPLPRRSRLAWVPAEHKTIPSDATKPGTEILRLVDARLWLSNDQIETRLFRYQPTVTGRPRSTKGGLRT